ncbi:carboxypeptidase-like regulatory domain-containing protein [Flavobacterium sp. 316]|uniref:carboxypeptidase-like regulatory domain-containing protein n=1 Tax=Flavobacterium sp. 316 TaxID=1603293 RepID=UPI000696A06B|nr:carboxypeptidase-like regulatory domain-containing protein [Flavobacterium sp. 316]
MKKISQTLFLLFSISIVLAQDTIPKKTGWRINDKPSLSSKNNILHIVNSNYVSEEFLKTLNPNNIKSINIYKRQASRAIYNQKELEGAIVITTQNISKKELKKLYKLYAYKYSENKGKEFTITGNVVDCEKNVLSGVIIKNLNSKNESSTDFNGNFKIEVHENDVLQFVSLNYESQKVLVEKQKNISVSLSQKAVIIPNSNDKIIVKKPIIYLYPTEETEVTLQFNFKGKLLTTFPKYENKWQVIVSPNGQIYDTKTKRNYSSLFWDGEINLPNEHYQYEDGFVIEKENLTTFFIEKLEYMGLNNQETNEFIQFWLPILEQNKYNFIHFLVNDDCNEISVNTIHPKPETSIRVYMEFYSLEQLKIIKEQKLPKTERKGFTIVEWGGTDVTNKIQKNEL